VFYAEKKRILNSIGTDYYSMQLFSHFYDNFNPAASFEYWTAMAVTDFEMIPEGFFYNQQCGFYAVFFNYRT
jgi:AraC family transcriptional regulator